jgi:hypothetical protein
MSLLGTPAAVIRSSTSKQRCSWRQRPAQISSAFHTGVSRCTPPSSACCSTWNARSSTTSCSRMSLLRARMDLAHAAMSAPYTWPSILGAASAASACCLALAPSAAAAAAALLASCCSAALAFWNTANACVASPTAAHTVAAHTGKGSSAARRGSAPKGLLDTTAAGAGQPRA